MTARLIVINTCFAALVVWAWLLGYVQQVFAGDMSHMVILHSIAALLGIGLVSVAVRSCEIASGRFSAKVLEIKQAHLWDMVEWLVLISLLGNAVGLYKASSGIDRGTLSTLDGIVGNASIMLGGVGVAMSATIVGITACFWLWVNARILDTATRLIAESEER